MPCLGLVALLEAVAPAHRNAGTQTFAVKGDLMPELANRITFYRDAVVVNGIEFPWHIHDRDIEVENPTESVKVVNLPVLVDEVTFRNETLR